MKKLLPLVLLSLGLLAHAQEGPLPTQTLVTVEKLPRLKYRAFPLHTYVGGDGS